MRSFMQSLTQGELGRNIEFVLESENPEICYGGIQSKRANLKNDFRTFESQTYFEMWPIPFLSFDPLTCKVG